MNRIKPYECYGLDSFLNNNYLVVVYFYWIYQMHLIFVFTVLLGMIWLGLFGCFSARFN